MNYARSPHRAIRAIGWMQRYGVRFELVSATSYDGTQERVFSAQYGRVHVLRVLTWWRDVSGDLEVLERALLVDGDGVVLDDAEVERGG